MIPFSIPLTNGTVESITLSSENSWEMACFSFAEKMDIAVKKLDIGYKFSTDKVKDPWCALASPAHWLQLKEKAAAACIPNLKSKAKVMLFEVQLEDFANNAVRMQRVERKVLM